MFEAARYGIDRLKEIVPIWKKEVGPNGEFWVEGEYIPGLGENEDRCLNCGRPYPERQLLTNVQYAVDFTTIWID